VDKQSGRQRVYTLGSLGKVYSPPSPRVVRCNSTYFTITIVKIKVIEEKGREELRNINFIELVRSSAWKDDYLKLDPRLVGWLKEQALG
jgi:hypothetical protein